MSRFKPTPGRTANRPAVEPGTAVSAPFRKTNVLFSAASHTLSTEKPEGMASPERAVGPEGTIGERARFRTALANGTRRLSLASTLAFIYFRFSFVHEYLTARYGLDLRVMLIFGGLATLSCLASGLFFAGFAYKSVRMWLLFFACMCVATVFSSWHAGSLNLLLPYVRTTLPLVLLIPGVAYTFEDIEKVLKTIALAGMTVIGLGVFSEDFRTGRFALNSVGGSIQDSNDFATHLILLLPAIVYLTMRKGRSIFARGVGIAFVTTAAYELLSTGSRGGLVSILVTGFYVFFKGSARLKLAFVLAVPLICAVVLPIAPSATVQRMLSVFASSDESEEAAESRAARTELLKASLRMTFSHPLFGVGPGEFQNYQGGLAASEGERGMWHETHNGYTQISSECGIPAIGFYIAGMVLTYRSLRRAAVANVARVSPLARTISTMFVGYGVCLFFLSQGYSYVLLVLCGLSVGIERLLQNSDHSAPAAT
jgi:putative inorganic carbon (hco3(-)) transporter